MINNFEITIMTHEHFDGEAASLELKVDDEEGTISFNLIKGATEVELSFNEKELDQLNAATVMAKSRLVAVRNRRMGRK